MAIRIAERTASSESLRSSSGGRVRNSVIANVESATTISDPTTIMIRVNGKMLPRSRRGAGRTSQAVCTLTAAVRKPSHWAPQGENR